MIYIALIVLLIPFMSLNSQAKTVIKCVLPAAHIPPFILGDTVELAEPNPGLTVETLRYIFSKHKDVELKIERLPYARMSQTIKSGEHDCAISVNIEEKQSDGSVIRPHRPPLDKNGQVDHGRALSSTKITIYYNKKNPLIWNNKELSPNLPVHSTIREFNKIAESHNIKVVTENLDLKRQVQQLEMGRINGILSLETLMDPMIKIYSKGLIEKNKIPLSTTDNFLVFSNNFFEKNKVLCEKVWETLRTFRTEKDYLKIEKKYFKLTKEEQNLVQEKILIKLSMFKIPTQPIIESEQIPKI